MGVNGETLQLHAVYKSLIFTTSHVRILISTTSHARILISTTSHVCSSEHEIEGSYDKITITIVPSNIRKKYHSFLTIQMATNL